MSRSTPRQCADLSSGRTMPNGRHSSKRLLMNPDPNAETANLAEVLTHLDNTLVSINKKIRTQGPEVDRILRNLSAISNDVKELTATLKKHPSGIIFSVPPSKSEMIK